MADAMAHHLAPEVRSLTEWLQPGQELRGHLMAGGYQVLHRLPQEGALGQVYAVQHKGTRIQYALKVLRPERTADPEQMGRLRRQADIWVRLRHGNLVALLDWGTTDAGQFFLVSEFVEGGTLAPELIARDRPFALAEVLELCRQVAGALEHLHGAGVVHGALGPQNLFLQPGQKGQRTYKLADFGQFFLLYDAKAAKANRSSSPPPRGLSAEAASYLSPEQARGELRFVDARSDQFALAALCYELLTGKPAFRQPGDDVQAVLRRVLDEDPVPAVLPPAVEAALARGLSRMRESRFASVQEFVAALGHSQPETQLVALPPPRPAPPPPRLQPRRVWALGFLLGVPLALGLWQLRPKPASRPPSPPLLVKPAPPVPAPVIPPQVQPLPPPEPPAPEPPAPEPPPPAPARPKVPRPRFAPGFLSRPVQKAVLGCIHLQLKDLPPQFQVELQVVSGKLYPRQGPPGLDMQVLRRCLDPQQVALDPKHPQPYTERLGR